MCAIIVRATPFFQAAAKPLPGWLAALAYALRIVKPRRGENRLAPLKRFAPLPICGHSPPEMLKRQTRKTQLAPLWTFAAMRRRGSPPLRCRSGDGAPMVCPVSGLASGVNVAR